MFQIDISVLTSIAILLHMIILVKIEISLFVNRKSPLPGEYRYPYLKCRCLIEIQTSVLELKILIFNIEM